MKIPEQPLFEISVVVHNLMVNPGDVPNDYERVLNENGNTVYPVDGEWYVDSDYYEDERDCLTSTPKLWYGIPQFDVDRQELEKLSKEELIALISKERGEK